ncbi:hypothetical protein ACMAZF_10395 [Psychrobium sp. nBUS_13]|uniref:hypothetical protein n=1 Tax=Psychrobium sp. nBUS_13 TaxID=3395319 RepID=UPI003EBA44F3
METIVRCFSRLDELFEILDMKLAEIESAIDKSFDPDSDGLFDKAEYFVGIGLVAAQQHLAEVTTFIGIDKQKSYKLGQRHVSGISYASAIDSAANFWKHEAEWWKDMDPVTNSNTKVKYHVETIAGTHDYPLSNFLYAISGNKEIRLECLLPIIEEWISTLENFDNVHV